MRTPAARSLRSPVLAHQAMASGGGQLRPPRLLYFGAELLPPMTRAKTATRSVRTDAALEPGCARSPQ